MFQLKRMNIPKKRALVAGWFSYEGSGTTAGDLMAKDLVQMWLVESGYEVDVALCREFENPFEFKDVDPSNYSIAIVVCGPYMPRVWEATFLGRFASCFVIGVNLSLPVPLDQWNPFDVLLERDSNRVVRPDVTFGAAKPHVPVVGMCLIEDYEGGETGKARAAFDRVLQCRPAAVVQIDTRLPTNAGGLRTSEEVESLLARMDLVLTTRLHGTVLSLKNGVPVVAIDPQPGSGKVKKQADALGWPIVFTVDDLQIDRLLASFDYCLTREARNKAQECARKAIRRVEDIRREFVSAIAATAVPGPKHRDREAFARSHDRPIGR
jgi:hypothetical protein